MKSCTVQKGDTLTSISQICKVPLEDILRFNNLTDPNKIAAGQVLLLEDPGKTYCVRKGDTLAGIAKSLGCEVGSLKTLNKIQNDFLSVGQILRVPEAPVQQDNNWYWPVQPISKYNFNTGRFLDPEYFRVTGSVHNAQDINGNGGGNTDWRDPIYSCHWGTVVDSVFLPVWGNIVKVYHPDARVWSVYGHLDTVLAGKGQKVKGRQQVGTMGRGANNVYLAHLHFEILKEDLPIGYWPSTHYPRTAAEKFIQAKYHDPVVFLRSKGAL